MWHYSCLWSLKAKWQYDRMSALWSTIRCPLNCNDQQKISRSGTRYCTVEANYRDEASRGLSATADLLVSSLFLLLHVRQKYAAGFHMTEIRRRCYLLDDPCQDLQTDVDILDLHRLRRATSKNKTTHSLQCVFTDHRITRNQGRL